MTVHTYWQQALDYDAAEVRRLAQVIAPFGPGVVADRSDPLEVTAAPTPDMTVRVATGWAKGDDDYLGYNDAAATLAIAAANPSNPRVDLIVMRWYDQENGDGSDEATVEVITGAPAASPTEPSTAGMVVVKLAQVLVAAATTTIAGGAITDVRDLLATPLLPTVRARLRTATLNVTTGTWTLVPSYPTEIASKGDVTYGAGIYTIVDAGLYLVHTAADWPSSSRPAHRRIAGIYINGALPSDQESRDTRFVPASADVAHHQHIAMLSLAAGDTIQPAYFHDAGATLAITPILFTAVRVA